MRNPFAFLGSKFGSVYVGVLPVSSLLYMLSAVYAYNNRIGFCHDELWDHIPAIHQANGESLISSLEVRAFGHPFPLVTGPYSGALKAWILAPILKCFGTAQPLIRCLNVFFAFLSLVFLRWALRPIVGLYFATAVFLLPFLDPDFLLTAPMDQGLILFQNLFISLMIGSLCRYLTERSQKFYWATWFCLGSILAQKLTSISVIIGTGIVIGFVEVHSIIRRRSLNGSVLGRIVTPAVLFILPLLPHLLYFSRAGFRDLFAATQSNSTLSYLERLQYNCRFFANLFDGIEWFRRITLTPGIMPETSLAFLLSVAILFSALVLSLFYGKNTQVRKYALISMLLFVTNFLVYSAFRGLNRPWHYLVLEPFFIFAICCSAAYLHAIFLPQYPKMRRLGEVCALGCALILVSLTMQKGIGLMERIHALGGTAVLSPTIFKVYDEISATNTKSIYAVNYSLGFPLYVLSNGAFRITKLAWDKVTPETISKILADLEQTPGSFLIYRYIRYMQWEPQWIHWLNKEPEIFDIMKMVTEQKDRLHLTSLSDERGTEFVIVRRKN